MTILSFKAHNFTGLLLGHRKKVKFCRILRDKFNKNGLFRRKFVEIFRTNFAEKQSVENGVDTFCWKLIDFALIC